MQKKLLNFLNNRIFGKFAHCAVASFFRALLLLFIVFSSSFFISCTTLKKAVNTGRPMKLRLYPLKKIPLMATSGMQIEAFEKKWNAIVTKKNETTSYTISLQANKEQLFISISDKNGNTVSYVSYMDNSISDLQWTENWNISAEDSVAIFQWFYYDINSVALMLNSINLRLSVENSCSENEEVRRIYNKRACIIKLVKKSDSLSYINYEKKLSIDFSEIQ